ncbi:MAG TPA: SGNH/GDSL hydrolase family protein [Balneolaceae bacterium]|nr:SGNH/GDSL hydrolase family protein [Balneolaceae bacterium]
MNTRLGKFSFPSQTSLIIRSALVGFLFIFILSSCSKTQHTRTTHKNGEWIGTWDAPQQLVEPRNMPPEPGLSHNTIRQLVHVSLGGDSLRLHFSNKFGTTPVTLKAVHIAVPVAADSSAILPATDKALTFDGKPGITIPPDSAVISDPFHFALKPLSNVAITIYYGKTTPNLTGHPGSRSTSYLVTGNKVSQTSFSDAVKTNHWYTIAGIDVVAPDSAASVVVLGNSITDGHASGTNKNARWTDDLARRLQANPATKEVSVLNEGLGGNCVLHDGCLGPPAVRRFKRDVIDHPKVKWLIVLEGINDIGTSHGPKNAAIIADRLIDAYKWMINTAHAHHIKVYGATMTPFAGSFYDKPGHIAAWKKVNKWIRNSGRFDAVIDFDKAMRDPKHPLHLIPKGDSGGHLHPDSLGYAMMAKSINLKLFQ